LGVEGEFRHFVPHLGREGGREGGQYAMHLHPFLPFQ
jgi:hypothetical protein